MIDAAELRFDENGLIPAVVQDHTTGAVLMLGWMSRDSIEATKTSGLVHFWSRSRQELWQKGATSGNTLQVRSMRPDCDGDTLLVAAHPTGPTCHTGSDTCFDGADPQRPMFGELGTLWKTIADRSERRPSDSYTTRLLDEGVDAAARKVTEEATEVLMAAKDHATGSGVSRLVEESADLVYHLFVLWAERGLTPDLVMAELESRRIG